MRVLLRTLKGTYGCMAYVYQVGTEQYRVDIQRGQPVIAWFWFTDREVLATWLAAQVAQGWEVQKAAA